ncbi:endoribonuclease Dcr-2 [Epargyreus clarus]|uniref:endoribonuclease Dcr-2 n=1 Tax=Epargyreus clarus TaxID=520877 RepID=UPI003C303777
MDLEGGEDENNFRPRPYQNQLEEIATMKNTLIHLPTGSGKTYIAIRLIERFKHQLQKPWGQGGKRTFFLVNTVPLAKQQQKVIRNRCPVQGVGAYTSENGVDYWDKAKWDEEMSQHQVVVMTSQILNDMLTHGYINIRDINLIIFDECHHAVDDHPMRVIMKKFESCPPSEQPRVLGLTATLLNGNVKLNKVNDTLRDLETTFHATIATVNDLGEVLTYSTNPVELVVHYKSPPRTEAANVAIEILTELQDLVLDVKLPVAKPMDVKLKKWQKDISSDPKKIVKSVKNMIASMIFHIDEMGVFGGSIAIVAYIILFERLKRRAVTAEEETLYKFTIIHSTWARMVLLESMQDDTGYMKILKHSSEQIIKLLNILKEYNPAVFTAPGVELVVNKKRKPLSAIIFTQQRFTSKVLYNILKEVKEVNPKDFGFLKHDFVVGFNVNPFNNTREEHYTKKLSQQALLKFANKDLNCLISTSVIEEGVDIPQCLLVVRYDPPLEYRSYIQSKGRARSQDANYIMLVNEQNREKFKGQFIKFQQTEQYIHSILVGNTDDRVAPTEDDIQETLYEEDDIPPYITEYGNHLSSLSAISLLNRYCSSLPRDKFTLITAMWILEKRLDKNLITIMMPIACPVKEPIEGTPYDLLKTAKRSAALNACIQLHKRGELDPVTLLPKQYAKVDFDIPEVKNCFPNWPAYEYEEEGAPKPGTKRYVRKHKKQFPVYLRGPKSWKNENRFSLHLVHLKPAFPRPTDSREAALYDLLTRSEGFGFLTACPLPPLCKFPLFLTIGEVITSIQVNYAVVSVVPKLFNLVKQFHYFIFNEVLDVAKEFVVFDGTENGLYVVPIKKKPDYDIDWETIQRFKEIRGPQIPSLEERMSLNVSTEEYQYTVVTPWYRGEICRDRYIVSNVLEHMTPMSHFSEAFPTFEMYYQTKYNVEILGCKHQPLLEVRNISSRMNCLMPRAATINTLSDKHKKMISLAIGDDKPKGFAEIFVPEFCIKQEFPGVLWYKAMMLPSIVHRITHLLIADDLRREIAKGAQYGEHNLPRGEEWLPIQVNLPVAVNSMLAQVDNPPPIDTIDRINNPIDQFAKRPHNIVSMKESVYQLQKKKINKEYPWDEQQEPLDIERNLSTATVMDIECYDTFVTASLKEETNPSLTVKSPQRQPNTPALLPPDRYNDKIALLSQTVKNRGPELRDILAALTTINSHDTFNLERLETLGDAFLKFSASLYLFHKFSTLNEGQLTNIKGRLIGNRNLYYAGARVNLGGRMKAEQFQPRDDFLVPGFFAPDTVIEFIDMLKVRPSYLIGLSFPLEDVLSGKLSKHSLEEVKLKHQDCAELRDIETNYNVQHSMQCYVRAQAVSDKDVADCVEALIGTYLLSGGVLGAIKVMEWFKIIPAKDNFAQYLKKRVSTVVTEKRATPEDVDRIMNYNRVDVEKILNYKFKDPSFLLEALSHPSYIRNRYTGSYERLEFLGDAILDFLITSHIFENCGDLKPGDLTDLRSALVNNVTFASYVVKLGLHKYLCTQLNPTLENAMMNFVEHQQQRDHEIVEDVLYLIEEEECQIAEYVDVPKVLSDIFESLTGAIYLDSGGDIQAVWNVVYKIMSREISHFSMQIPKQPVRVLYETIHACPSFGEPQTTKKEPPKVMIPVTISKQGRQHTVYGVGSNKSQAKRAAAKLALKILGL